jgi:hypothetical protein
MRPKMDLRELQRHDISFENKVVSVSSKNDIETILRQLVDIGKISKDELENMVDIKTYPTPRQESDFKWQKGPISKDAKTTSTKPPKTQ